MTADPTRLTMQELAAAYRRRETTPTEATEAYLARIDALDGRVSAYLTVTRDRALAAAGAADARYRNGGRSVRSTASPSRTRTSSARRV